MNDPHATASAMSCKATRPDLGFIVLVLLLVFPSTGVVQKYAGVSGVLGYAAVVAFVLYITWRFGIRVAPLLLRHFSVLSALTLVALAICFAMVHPIEDGRGVGKSSDRDDGLNLAVTRMADGKSPYYPSDKFAGPLSVLPGAIVLSAPFVALGESGYQNWFWLAVFFFTACRVFRDRALALVLLIVPLALSPAALYEYISGGDMIANGIYVAVFFLMALNSWTNPDSVGWSKWLACVLLGMGLASRPNFLLLMPLFGAALWRTVGLRHAIVAAGLVTLVAAAITVPFYLHDPAGFSPLLARQKLAIVDSVLPWASKAMIGMTLLTGLLGGWMLLQYSGAHLQRAFFRWATVVTLCPMICAVTLFSWVNGRLDFGFMNDRFGLMFVCFALLGWGGRLGDVGELGLTHETHAQTKAI